MSASFREEKNGGGSFDFEAPTRDVHTAGHRGVAAATVLSQAGRNPSVASQKNNGPGDATQANVNRGGTPQQDGLEAARPHDCCRLPSSRLG
ncbi:hypothetical protein AYO44_08395 [Planctomycetaceae bacterium SCGC AG-212-F19]|nr:hypothetical protein AYO44_08395 [Planctomycetaceae bacterium SCGC AG-212-F19]